MAKFHAYGRDCRAQDIVDAQAIYLPESRGFARTVELAAQLQED